ncbi:serine hydrolase domain-containing protein [Streptomyces sp. NPDC050743]|uniref:serine hydrolase domain-containing protein n=1 Tax=Streptomyces sp. NPDC050743 TaxID=3365634 RepID=UPI00378815F6
MPIDVRGTVAEGFEDVREEFAAVLAGERDDPGAQLVVYRHGRRVVDLWGGDGIDGETLTTLYSIAKGAAHLVVALLVQDGVLDLDREVAAYWPEFGVHGKDRLTLGELLEHQAGLVSDAEQPFTIEELADDRITAARLAGRRPLWEPGTAWGYHAFVIGALTGEVVRRVTGRSIQELYEERIRAPYGLDYYLGMPAEVEPRWVDVQPLVPTPEEAALLKERVPAPDSIRGIAFNAHGPEPTDLVAFGNHPRVKALGPASSGGVGNARGVAGMFAAAISTVDGRPPLLTPATAALFRIAAHPGRAGPGHRQREPLRARLRVHPGALPVPRRGHLRAQRRDRLAGLRRPGERHRVRLHPAPVRLPHRGGGRPGERPSGRVRPAGGRRPVTRC